jgi:hypothetical protein
MAYFKRRLSQAPRDATFALEFVKHVERVWPWTRPEYGWNRVAHIFRRSADLS